MIDCSRDIEENLFGESSVEKFRNDVIGHFAANELPPSDLLEESGKLFHFLKISVPKSVFSKLIQTYIVVTPHSAGP
ncbi:hypothetical protein JTE90_013357 [Oedothorax gibbosus]|uniref:Uncharacterized protein n=1 Tax=Oedothorax gibbosus TaxID=931172 RepID=A0AAV6TVV5_9ARAC|nr:hypothetical protein JTE90_013357 [Oedothorax gibbosus]